VELGAEEEEDEEEEEVGGVGGTCLAMCLGIATTGATRTREPGWEIELPLGGLTSGVIGLFSILSSW